MGVSTNPLWPHFINSIPVLRTVSAKYSQVFAECLAVGCFRKGKGRGAHLRRCRGEKGPGQVEGAWTGSVGWSRGWRWM